MTTSATASATATKTKSSAPPGTGTMSLAMLTAMVVGSMVGAGVFSLPSNFAQATGVMGAAIAWGIAGSGMLMLAFVFQKLAIRKPELDAGVYSYAKAGFGDYVGFIAAFGFWASACVGNVTYWVLIKSTLGAALPQFGEGDTLLAVLISSVGIWTFHFLILGGVKEAAGINQIVTVAKILPILLFILVVGFALKADLFTANLLGDAEGSYGGTLFEQVRATMLVTVFVFLGVEGASVYSRYARKREDVGRATVLGFVAVLALFASVTILSYGVMLRPELSELRQPSMAGVLEALVGRWGAVFIGAGLIVSVLGAYLAWTLMAAEVAYLAAKNHDMPRAFARTNRKNAPATALLASSGLTQAFLLMTLLSEDAFAFSLELTSSLSLVPYLLAAAFAAKVALTGDTYEKDASGRGKDIAIACLATLYTAFLLYAAGLKFLLLSCLIYAPGTLLFMRSRREQNRRTFNPIERAIFLVTAAGAVVAVVALSKGWVSI